MSEKNETYITISEDRMLEMFKEVKSNDLSRSQFESEKTARIAALSSALQFTTGYDREQIMSRLNEACYSNYSP